MQKRKLKKIKKKSPHRREALCPVYGRCGGCQLQHLAYEQQLLAKEEIIRDAFAKYTKLENLPLRPIIGMDDPTGYRNKAQLQVGERDGDIIAGLYATDSHRLIEALHNCIAHQDYTLQGRINVVEKPDELIFTNVGDFIFKAIEV